jgi:hypothetical protein
MMIKIPLSAPVVRGSRIGAARSSVARRDSVASAVAMGRRYPRSRVPNPDIRLVAAKMSLA